MFAPRRPSPEDSLCVRDLENIRREEPSGLAVLGRRVDNVCNASGRVETLLVFEGDSSESAKALFRPSIDRMFN